MTQLDIDQIRGWVREAGEIALHYFGHVTAEWKSATDPVTKADREIEQLLTARIHAAYPDHGILGEEYGGETLDREYIWTIDPIDGTRAYVEGLPSWCITIALLRHRVPEFGLIYIPLYDDWTYTDGDDVIQNDRIITDRLADHWESGSYIMARSDAHTLLDIEFGRVMTMSSTASHLAYTARGSAVATITHDSYLWDFAAGLAITAKQGGETRFLNGEVLDFQTRDLARRVEGFYITGHPDVIERLIPLVHRRDQLIEQPVWSNGRRAKKAVSAASAQPPLT
jgi:myo-inositol-1(or 4)-monophosphatase